VAGCRRRREELHGNEDEPQNRIKKKDKQKKAEGNDSN
jgi:hypothetical protein